MKPPAPASIRRALPADFTTIAHLARRIWPACFRDLITPEQCEYMLGQRYTPEAMAKTLTQGATYELIEDCGQPVGFGAHGPSETPSDWKLFQIYVLPDRQGQGLGRLYIEHVSQIARTQGRSALLLTVNKRNDRARLLYERCGFAVRESACFDIGNGFVMDDFVMVKPLHTSPPN